MDACVEKLSLTTEESCSLSAALNQVLLCPHHCRLNNANVAWALDTLTDKFQVTTTAQFVALDLDSASAHLLRNWPVQQFLRCLQSELVATQGGSDLRLAAVETSVDSFLQVVPQLRQNPAMRACVATQLIECQIDTYDTLRSVPLTDLVAILGHCDDGGKVASSIIDEIRDMEDFSMARLTNAYNAVELWTAGMPLTTDIAVAKMTKLHQLADTLERHIRHTACPLFRGSTDELEALLAATKGYLSKLWLASQHLSATTAEPSLRQPDTELLRITAEDSRFQVNENLLSNTLRLDPEQGSRVVAFVGPTHSGKSTLICHMCPHMPQRPRVARTGVFQPTTNNVHLYDDVMDASNDNAAPRETPVPRTLILDVEGIDASPNIPEPGGASPDVELERLLQVSQLPRLCYTIANVIVYVDEANFARTSPFKYIIDFAQQSTTGVTSSFPPSLLIVCNKSTVADMELSVEDTTHSYLETHDKDKMLCQAFLRVLCVYVPDKGTEKNYFLFLQRTNLLKMHLEMLLQEQQQARRQHNSNLSRAQWGDKFRWIAHHFHDEQLKVTPYEVSLKIGPQFQLEAATLGFFRTVYDDAPNANRWHNYRMACKASITLLAMLTVAANNDSLLSRTLVCPLPSHSGESEVQGCENAQKASFVDEKLYRRLVRFIWQHLREIGPCQATRPHCVDGQGKPIHCTQARNGHHSHRGQSDIWMPESSPLPLLGRIMWAKARKQFGKLFYRQLARPFNVWDGSFVASTEESELEIELADVFLQEHAAYSKLQDRPLVFFARHIAFLQRSVRATRSGPSSTICFVCQTNPCRGRLLVCGHPFCQFCIEKLRGMQSSCPVCAQPVNTSVEFQFLSSNESYLSIDPRDFVDQFRRDPNMTKSVTVISVIGRHVPQQASDLSKIRPRVSPQMLKHPLARLFFLLEQNGAQFLSKGPTNMSAIYFSDGFVLVHYNVDYDDTKLWANNSTTLPHPLYFARCTSDVVVLLKRHDKAEGNLLCQLWRGRYKEILLPPRQSGVCWAVLLASMYKDWLKTSRDGSNPAVAIGFRAGSIHLLRPSADTDYQGEAHRATLRLVSLIHKAGFFTCQRAHLTEQVVLLATLWRYVVAQSFIHHLQELCDVWEVEPGIMAPILEPLLDLCRQHVHRALIDSPAQAQADATPGALRDRVAGSMPAAPTRACSTEFALWCINVLEAQPEDISFSHLLRWIRVESAKDRAATNLELFPVHARVASLYDLRESVGAAYVERLYSACQLPTTTATTEPASGFCVLCLDWARGEGVCAPLCGHLICGRCCHGLANLAQHLAEQRRREGGPPRRGFSGECLFRCPICLEWDVARIHHYIAACRWRDDGAKAALLSGFFAEITRTSYSVLHRSIDEQEVVMPSDEPADVCGVRVGQWRGQTVAIKSYDLVGCQQADFQREMTALVLASGCKHILPVLGACPLFQVVWPLHTHTLEHVLWSTSASSLINALGLLKDVSKAICCLHALGFLHKNVNPGAIVIQERPHAGRPKAQLWCTERIGGEDQLRIYAASSPYRAPECVGPGGGAPTQASDVYGLGKTIKKTLVKVLYNARMALDNWEQIDLLPEACTHDLAQLIDSCLDVDSAKRPSVGDCVKVLSHAIRNQRDMCRSGGSKERLGVAEMDNLQPIAHDLQLPLPVTVEKYLLADPDCHSRVANIQRMLTNKSGPLADIVGAFRLAFAERYSSKLSCPSTVLAAVSEVKTLATVMVNHLRPFVADSDAGSSFFALKEAVAGEGIYASLHDMVFERIKSSHKHKDELISQKMASWQHLTLAALEAPVEWCLRTVQPYHRQIEDLQHLPKLASPYRKAALLRQVFGDAIAEAQQSHQGRKPLATGYDDTVAVIQYLMLKAQIPHLYSEFYYMDVLLDEATNEELELRSLLGKMGGFIEMVLEDNLEVPIGSVKDALLEATAQRESPKDMALLADIFAFIAQALEQMPLDNVMLPIPIPIKERIKQAALAELWNASHPSADGPQWLDQLLLLAGVRLHREQFYLATRYSPVLYHELKWLLHEMHDHQKDDHLHQHGSLHVSPL